MLLPIMRLFINYANGGAIYLSDLHPIVYNTQEIESNQIDIVVWLLEEKELLTEFRNAFPLNTKHYYYCLASFPIDNRIRLYDKAFNPIYHGVDKGKTVLIVSRDLNDRVSILLSFFIQCIRWGERFLIYDFLNYIPKLAQNWTESFIIYVRLFDPEIRIENETLEKLYNLEDTVIDGLNDSD